MNSIITSYDRIRQASIFGDSSFVIYKTIIKLYIIKEIHSIIDMSIKYI